MLQATAGEGLRIAAPGTQAATSNGIAVVDNPHKPTGYFPHRKIASWFDSLTHPGRCLLGQEVGRLFEEALFQQGQEHCGFGKDVGHGSCVDEGPRSGRRRICAKDAVDHLPAEFLRIVSEISIMAQA